MRATTFAAPKVEPTHTDAVINNLSGKISPDPIDILNNFTLDKYIKAHKKEKAFLLNPYFDNPTKYFAYEFDDILEEVKIVPAKAIHKDYVEASEKYYGINRIELKNVRYSIFTTFRIIKKVHTKLVQDRNDEAFRTQIKKQLDNMLSSKYVFAGMNKYFDSRL